MRRTARSGDTDNSNLSSISTHLAFGRSRQAGRARVQQNGRTEGTKRNTVADLRLHPTASAYSPRRSPSSAVGGPVHRVGRGITMPSEVEVVAAGRGPVSVLLHLWAKFRNQTRSIVADKGLGNWDDERVCHVKFRWSRTSGTHSIHGLSSESSPTRFLDRQLHLRKAVNCLSSWCQIQSDCEKRS